LRFVLSIGRVSRTSRIPHLISLPHSEGAEALSTKHTSSASDWVAQPAQSTQTRVGITTHRNQEGCIPLVVPKRAMHAMHAPMNPPTHRPAATWAPADDHRPAVELGGTGKHAHSSTEFAQRALTTAVGPVYCQVRSRDQASRQDTLMLVTCEEVRVPPTKPHPVEAAAVQYAPPQHPFTCMHGGQQRARGGKTNRRGGVHRERFGEDPCGRLGRRPQHTHQHPGTDDCAGLHAYLPIHMVCGRRSAGERRAAVGQVPVHQLRPCIEGHHRHPPVHPRQGTQGL